MVELEKILKIPEHSLRADCFAHRIEQVGIRWPSISLSVRNETAFWLSSKMGRTIDELIASDKKQRVEQGLSLFRKSHWYEIESAHTSIVSVEMIGSSQKRMEHLLNEAIKIANSFEGEYQKPEIELYNGDPNSPYSTKFKINFKECC